MTILQNGAVMAHCWDCTRKHLAGALVFMEETYAGYPEHRWLAVGDLLHAERESRSVNADFADRVRMCRVGIMSGYEQSKAFAGCIFDLIVMACKLSGEDDIIKHRTPGSSKRYDIIEDWLNETQKGQ